MMGIRPGKQMSKAGTSWVKWVQVQNKPMWTYEVIHIYAFFSLIRVEKGKSLSGELLALLLFLFFAIYFICGVIVLGLSWILSLFFTKTLVI